MNNYYLGGDVSKGYSDFIIIDEEKRTVVDSFQLDDTETGHQELSKILKKLLEKYQNSIIYSAVESTGGYENNWFNSLLNLQKELNIEVARLNPFGTKHNSDASMNRIVTDKNAARNIAEYLINHKGKVNYKNDDKYFAMRRQWKFVRILSKQKTQLYNQLESVLYTANPEVLSYCKHGYPNWLLKVIERYPTARELSRARISKLSSIAYVTEPKAVSLINKAKQSVAAATDAITADLITSLVKQINQLDKLIKKQSKLIADNCNLPELKILKSFIGIGDYSAVGLMINISSVDKFESTKKLSSFFGLHPIWKQSGDGTYGMHMSKKGNSEVRHILYMVTRTAIVHNPLIKEIYERHIKKGMNKTAAMGVCMHKILRIIYGMLKNNEEFNPGKDRANSMKMLKNSTHPKTVVIKQNKLRRYQQPDESAPISNRQAKKRKKQKLSQDEITSSSTGSNIRSFHK